MTKTKESKTDFDHFPPSIYHLVRHVIKKESRKLYSTIPYFDQEKVKKEQIRRAPYEISSIQLSPANYIGNYINIEFINKITNEKNSISTTFTGLELIKGLEQKLDIKHPNFENRDQHNKYLKKFKGINVEGVYIEYLNGERKKCNHLFGIFVD